MKDMGTTNTAGSSAVIAGDQKASLPFDLLRALRLMADDESLDLHARCMAEIVAAEINRLRFSLKEMLDCYWGAGDGETPPDFILKAQRLVDHQSSDAEPQDGVVP